MIRFTILPALLLTFLLETPVIASDFDKGVDAILRGDYTTALRKFKPLAEQGHVGAQTELGLMYAAGIGVTRNYKTAVKWYKHAAEKENAFA